jgi:O-antigen biosynthesis protein WbqP
MLKRIFDVSCSLLALLVMSPILLITALFILVDSRGPILFAQRRIGIHDKEFLMYKFRTMVVGTPEVATDKLTNSKSYITKIGYYLRKYSIDELPQLINILLGDMSIVGPRPALYNQYDLRKMRNKIDISSIRPGLTGWAQINGRDEISLEDKVKFDFYYLQNRSFLLDIKIIYRTVFSVSAGNGVEISDFTPHRK